MAEQSLKNKTVKGVAWSAVDNVSQHVVTFVVSVVLARLLTPDDYGLIGIVTIFTLVSQALVNAGFTSALIRKKDATDDDYNTVFIVNLCISLILYFLIYIVAPATANIIGKYANGIADDCLTTTLLAFDKTVFFAPTHRI